MDLASWKSAGGPSYVTKFAWRGNSCEVYQNLPSRDERPKCCNSWTGSYLQLPIGSQRLLTLTASDEDSTRPRWHMPALPPEGFQTMVTGRDMLPTESYLPPWNSGWQLGQIQSWRLCLRWLVSQPLNPMRSMSCRLSYWTRLGVHQQRSSHSVAAERVNILNLRLKAQISSSGLRIGIDGIVSMFPPWGAKGLVASESAWQSHQPEH